MSVAFRCDYCGHEVDNGDNMQASNLLHKTLSRAGNDRKGAGTMFPGVDYPDFCNSCYKVLLDWLENDLRTWIRDNYPLSKESDDNG